MSNWLLYLIVVFSWGTSWLAIKFELGEVSPQVSVAYRFILSGLILCAFCLLRGKKFKFTLAQHGRIFLQAFFFFSTNYIFIYRSSAYLPSGLVSVVFSTVTFMNIFNARIFMGQKPETRTIWATLVGFTGILLVFSRDIAGASSQLFHGIILCLISGYSASLGNIISAKNQKVGLPILETTAIGMLYGGLWTLLLSGLMGESFVIPTRASYYAALIFLSLFASILAFMAYLHLLSRIGPTRAAYSTLVFPLVAVTLSVFFEGYVLGPWEAIGLILALGGNYLVMFRPSAA